MKKGIIVFLLISILLTGHANAQTDTPGTSAASMILFHGDSGMVLAEKNADQARLIASTTKIMTALVALEKLDPDSIVEIDPQWTKVEGSSMYLRPDERYTVRELLYGLLLASGNDAALALAGVASASGEDFVEWMNQKAQELELQNTHFTNPHGLNDEHHKSTARDLATIMHAAMKNEVFREIVGAKSYSTHGATYINHNKLLWRCAGVNGGKTGYTKAAGRCLVTTCQRDGLELICVTLSAPNDWQDHAKLYEWAFDTYCAFKIETDEPVSTVPVVSGEQNCVAVVPEKRISLCIPQDSVVQLQLRLPRFVFAEQEKGEQAGMLELMVDGSSRGTWPLCWEESVSRNDGVKTVIQSLYANILGSYYF